MSHNQNPASKWSAQNHVKNEEGGYPQLFMARGLSLTFIYPGFEDVADVLKEETQAETQAHPDGRSLEATARSSAWRA